MVDYCIVAVVGLVCGGLGFQEYSMSVDECESINRVSHVYVVIAKYIWIGKCQDWRELPRDDGMWDSLFVSNDDRSYEIGR